MAMTLTGWIDAKPVYCGRMGFNPFREQKRSALDVGLVVGALVVTAALLVWGFFGG